MLSGVGWPGLLTCADFRKAFQAREQHYLEPTLSPSLLMVPHAGREAEGGGKRTVFFNLI